MAWEVFNPGPAVSFNALYPGEYLIFKRDRPTSNWELAYRDDSLSTMVCRYNYQRDTLRPGQGVQFFNPKGELVNEFDCPLTRGEPVR